jgi:hypothetical protein
VLTDHHTAKRLSEFNRAHFLAANSVLTNVLQIHSMRVRIVLFPGTDRAIPTHVAACDSRVRSPGKAHLEIRSTLPHLIHAALQDLLA